jgi:ATP-binding cassette subfamily D (ALD) protein 2
MIMVSLPILTTSHLNSDEEENGSNTGSKVSQRTEYFTTASNLLKSGADAVERLMSSYKEIVELAGYTSRVSEMFQVFDEVSRGVYKKAVVDDETANQGILEFRNGQPVANGEK